MADRTLQGQIFAAPLIGQPLRFDLVQLHVRPSTVGATPLRPGTRFADIEALLRQSAWQRDAACKEHTDLKWLPMRGEQHAAQVAICTGCLVP